MLASATRTSADDWGSLDGPDSRVGVDYRYRYCGSGADAYLSRDQDQRTISVDGEKLYDGEVPAGPGLVQKAHTHRKADYDTLLQPP